MKVKSVQRLAQGEPTPMPRGVLPYTTKSGLQIGSNYFPKPRHNISRDEEFWQAILLGIAPEWPPRRVAIWFCYLFSIVCVFAAFSMAKD